MKLLNYKRLSLRGVIATTKSMKLLNYKRLSLRSVIATANKQEAVEL